jgi:hypothetical protein
MRIICSNFHCARKYPLGKTALNNWVRYGIILNIFQLAMKAKITPIVIRNKTIYVEISLK